MSIFRVIIEFIEKKFKFNFSIKKPGLLEKNLMKTFSHLQQLERKGKTWPIATLPTK